jgi:hypothetical protein
MCQVIDHSFTSSQARPFVSSMRCANDTHTPISISVTLVVDSDIPIGPETKDDMQMVDRKNCPETM